MAGRGSGIGLSFQGGLGTPGTSGPSNSSLRTANAGQVYADNTGKGGFPGMSQMETHHWLWILVVLEIGLLALLRGVVFKQYHGG